MKTILVVFVITITLSLVSCSNTEENKQTNSQNNKTDLTSSDNNNQNHTSSESNIVLPQLEIKNSKLDMSSEMLIKSKISMGVILKSKTVELDMEREIVTTMGEFNSVIMEDDTMLTLPDDILFDFDSDQLKSEAEQEIDRLVQVIESTDSNVIIIGHTDSQGNDDYNQGLSERRADSVLNAFVNLDINSNRLRSEGRGASEPIARNTHSDGSDNPEGRQQNRRVEIVIQDFN